MGPNTEPYVQSFAAKGRIPAKEDKRAQSSPEGRLTDEGATHLPAARRLQHFGLLRLVGDSKVPPRFFPGSWLRLISAQQSPWPWNVGGPDRGPSVSESPTFAFAVVDRIGDVKPNRRARRPAPCARRS